MLPASLNNLSLRRLRVIASTTIIGALFLILLLTYTYPTDALNHLPGSWSRPPHLDQSLDSGATTNVDWSRYAYVQYVTNSEYLCNSVMLFEILSRLGSKADRLMMYPSQMAVDDSDELHLLHKARDEYKVRLQPVEVQHRSGSDPTWADSFTKLLAFNQTQYDRVMSLDSDATILQPMDELFLLPPCPVAMPRAYWLFPGNPILSSQLMLVQPSDREFDRVMEEVNANKSGNYDMEIVNTLYKDQALVLPHRKYDMLTGEFRSENHAKYLGSEKEEWDPVAVLNEAKFLHFSDWPVPKPWIPMSDELRREHQPKCYKKDGVEQCIERDMWNGFYSDFMERRERVCKSKGKRDTRKYLERNRRN